MAESLRRAPFPSSSIGNSRLVTEGLLAIAHGDPGDAVSCLTTAVDRERELGNDYTAACVELDLALALEATNMASEAAEVRARARSMLDSLGCINPF